MKSTIASFVLSLLVLTAIVVACTPGARQDVLDASKVGCVLVKELAPEDGPGGVARDVCATATELAPFVGDILADREDLDLPSSPAVAAAAGEEPSVVVARRTCHRHHKRARADGGGLTSPATSSDGGAE